MSDATHAPRGPDKTEPRNGMIFGYTVLAVACLFGLRYVFESYLDSSRQRVSQEHLAESQASETLRSYRDAQGARLREGGRPIDRAMSDLATGRDRFPAIRPTQSQDLEPRRGWMLAPREVGRRPAPPPPPPPVETPVDVLGAEAPAGAAPATPAAPAAPAALGGPQLVLPPGMRMPAIPAAAVPTAPRAAVPPPSP